MILLNELKIVASKSTFKKKKFNIAHIDVKSNCEDCNIIFVDRSYTNKLPEIYNTYSNRQVLIISFEAENKLFTMVNLYRQKKENTISYEINRDNIENEEFTYTPELLVYGGSLIDLKELYLSSATELIKNKEKLESILYELKEIEKEKNKYQNKVEVLSKSVKYKEQEYNNLSQKVFDKDEKLKQKSDDLEQQREKLYLLENELNKKQIAVSIKESELTDLNSQYEANLKLIADQSIEIMKQNKELVTQTDQITTQTETIVNQRKYLFLFSGMMVLFIAAIVAIYSAFKLRKQMNAKLKILVEQRTAELNISKEYYRILAEYSPVPLFEINITELLSFVKKITQNGITLKELLKNDKKIIKDCLYKLKFVDLNKQAYKLFKTDDIELFKTNFHQLFTVEDSSFLLNGFVSLSQKESTYTNEAVFKTFDGEYIQAMVTWILLPENIGEQNHLLIAVHDITKLKKYEAELKNHRNNLEQLVQERSKEIIDLNSLLTSTNETLNTKNTTLKQQREELALTLKKLKNTQEQLVESEKMASLGMLTAGVAHEINNPINFINSGSQALRIIFEDMQNLIAKLGNIKNKSSEEMQNKIIEIIHEISNDEVFENIAMVIDSIESGVVRTTEIVNSLRAYSYDSSESFQKYNLQEAIENSLVILANKFKGRISINKNYSEDFEIECLPGKINQAFVNILSNAIDAIDGKGTIDVSIEKDLEQNKALVKIWDTGTGIDKENINKAFEPFFTTKEVGTGTGLGLYITYGIIKQHNGFLTIDSEIGKGTLVTVTLPLKEKQATY
ncbi:MAG: DUF4154 domain-containing protein [Salinivirgaceae bacterium]|nr:DUF4154 domain-containing protein [Salinivirgaceae bacterium]